MFAKKIKGQRYSKEYYKQGKQNNRAKTGGPSSLQHACLSIWSRDNSKPITDTATITPTNQGGDFMTKHRAFCGSNNMKRNPSKQTVGKLELT